MLCLVFAVEDSIMMSLTRGESSKEHQYKISSTVVPLCKRLATMRHAHVKFSDWLSEFDLIFFVSSVICSVALSI